MIEILHNKLYYPILKGKKGEFAALKECPQPIKESMIPLIELLDYTPTQLSEEQLAKRKKPVRTYDDHLSSEIKQIIAAWQESGMPIFIDTHLVPIELLAGTGRIALIFESLYDAGIMAIPVIHTSYDPRISNEYKSIIDEYQTGFCLRLNTNDTEDEEIADVIEHLLNRYQQLPGQIDLLIDNRYVTEDIIARTARLLATTINDLPHLAEWRSLVLASAAFPVDLSNHKPDSTTRIPRSDWALWQKLLSKSLERMPNFGDYAIAHPEIRDIGNVIPNMSASLRYTADKEFIIVKGRGVKHNGFGQTHALSQKIVSLPEYSGEHFSPGDNWIKRCALNRTTPGNSTTWRQAATSHHLHKVIEQLASLAAALRAA
ncbi:MAG: beta family protein [Flavipsychrobacter sp.]|nr:beta family protein [Flavipsychrobacter sp.]